MRSLGSRLSVEALPLAAVRVASWSALSDGKESKGSTAVFRLNHGVTRAGSNIRLVSD